MTVRVKYKLSVPEKYCSRLHQEPYPSSPYRSELERDRDRILYSKEFRRLSDKTQVFLSTSHDHVRTRLTHTLEVSQISRVTANNLELDPTLAEAIAFGHDVGHTPFGHVGEKTLNLIMNGCDTLASFQDEMNLSDKGFKHNLQGLRVACDLEQLYGNPGLNLTNFTLWGIQHHTKDRWGSCGYLDNKSNLEDKCSLCLLNRNPHICEQKDGLQLGFYRQYYSAIKQDKTEVDAWSFEGQVVKLADEIAQRHHDIEDAIYMSIISKDELLEYIDNNFRIFFDEEDESLFLSLSENKDNNRLFMPIVSKFIVGMLNKNLIYNSKINLNNFILSNSISSRDDFVHRYPNINASEAINVIGYAEGFGEAQSNLQDFLKNRILNSFEVQRMDGKGRFIIRRLFKAYLTNPKQLHDSTMHFAFSLFDNTYKKWSDMTESDLGQMRYDVDSTSQKSNPKFMIALLRAICDHIAGMTDNFAMNEYSKLYG